MTVQIIYRDQFLDGYIDIEKYWYYRYEQIKEQGLCLAFFIFPFFWMFSFTKVYNLICSYCFYKHYRGSFYSKRYRRIRKMSKNKNLYRIKRKK